MLEKDANEILLKFLEKKTREAEQSILERGTLSDEHAIPLLLKTQFNHIAHLDMEITAIRIGFDQKFEKVDQRFEKLEHKIETIYTFLGIGFAGLAVLMTIFQLLK